MQTEELLARIDLVEKRNLLTQGIALLAIFLALVVPVLRSGRGPKADFAVQNVVRARCFLLVDENEQERGGMFYVREGRLGLALLDENGKVLFSAPSE